MSHRRLLRHSIAPAVLAWAALLTSCGPRQAPAPPPETHAVAIEGLAYQPATLTLRVGDSVIWTNKDPFPHTVTSASGAFDSKDIAPGATWTFTAIAAGEFPYSCTYHATMKAAISVK